MTLALGQRWVSDTESELGLGTIVALDHRMVTLLFPASGENRLYAIKEAPITRVTFNEGDTIQSADEWQLEVKSVEDNEGLITYVGTRLDNGEENVELRETFLDHFIKFNKPQDRLFAGQVDRFEWYNMRYQTRQMQHQQSKSELRGLVGGRVSLIGHQLYIAEEVGKRYAPRVLLADEVGLGKTIEAGLIIHQQLLSGRASRVLIVVPETLQHQWLVEMLRRFNLKFSIFDEERCAESHMDAANPFETEQLVLTSLSFLTKRKRWFDFAALADWDLLVVDEAHHLEWSPEKPSMEYQRIEALAEETKGLILLTATPDQLGHQSHFARLRLLDPNRFYDYEQFVAEEADYKAVANAANQLLDEVTLDAESEQTLTNLLKETDISEQLNALKDDTTRDTAKQHLIGQLLDRHGTGRVLFRNSRSGISGFPGRQVLPVPMAFPTQYKTAQSVYSSFNSNKNPQDLAQQLLFPEQIFCEFEGADASWTGFDPRVAWLTDLLLELKQEKVLVICAHAQTALILETALRTAEGIRAAVFHEGMSIIERDKAAAYFAQEEDSAQVLLCSEIGSEGRNFQFAHHLVLFDLPLNPDLLEQRIGRLDRIGQTQTIKIHVPYFENTAQHALYRWYHEGLEVFEHTCATGRNLYDKYQESLFQIMANPTDTDSLESMIETTHTEHLALKQVLEDGRDKLLELNSGGRGQTQELLDQISIQDNSPELAIYMLKLFDVYGVNQDDRGEQSIVLTPSEHMMSAFPMLYDDGITVTFDRDTALSQEDIHFLSWDHPMVQGGMELVTSADTGNTSVAIIKNKALPAGTYFLELIFVAETTAPTELQLGRYLPITPIRVLLDKAGNDLSDKVSYDNFSRQLSPIGRQTANKLVTALQGQIHKLITDAKPHAEQQMDALKAQALQLADESLQQEIERLEALKKVNPSIRDEEVEFLYTNKKQVSDYIQRAQLNLDAVRLIVASE